MQLRVLSSMRCGGKVVAIIPRHPPIRMRDHFRRMQLELIQVVQRVDVIQLYVAQLKKQGSLFKLN